VRAVQELWPDGMRFMSVLYCVGDGFSFALIESVRRALRLEKEADFGEFSAVFDRTIRCVCTHSLLIPLLEMLTLSIDP
jgi:hypothetical protein